MKKQKKNRRRITRARTARRQKGAVGNDLKGKMLRVLMRRKKETLADACKAAGMPLPMFYYYLKRSSFGDERRGKGQRFSLSALDAKKLAGLVKRQEKLQVSLERFTRSVLGSMNPLMKNL